MNPVSPSPSCYRGAAFTLVEVLLSITVLSLIMTLLVNTLTVTQRVYTGAQSRVEQFREARVAFESITRRLSQATLNTYWDYNDPNAPTVCAPVRVALHLRSVSHVAQPVRPGAQAGACCLFSSSDGSC